MASVSISDEEKLEVGDLFSADAKTDTVRLGNDALDRVGFFGKAPAAQQAAIPDTSAATLAALETEVNKLKAVLRVFGLIA